MAAAPVGRSTANNDGPADRGGRRHVAELADQFAAIIPRLQSLEEHLIEAFQYMNVPANATHAKMMQIYTVLKFVMLGGQVMDPRFQLAFTVIAVAVKCVKCGLLMYTLFGDMPWLLFVLCVLMAFAFIAN